MVFTRLPQLPLPLARVLMAGWMARPHFVAGSAIVYIVGVLVARSETHILNWTALGLGLGVMWLAQIATHFFNEYFDQLTDALNTHRTLFSGGSGILAVALVSPRTVLWAGTTALLLTIMLFLALASQPTFGLTTALIFGLATLGAVGYSVPPLALANRGWGELDTSLIAGILAPLFAYNLQTGRVSVTLFWACLPLALLVFANMINVAFPDYEADRAVGKRTLVVLLGPARAARFFTIALIVGIAAAWLTLRWSWPALLAQAAALPFGVLSLGVSWGGGYWQPQRFGLNTFLGTSALAAVAAAEAIAFLFAA
jgi:1,4-dihydroxy-2-naphthoate polyprenyltransferase